MPRTIIADYCPFCGARHGVELCGQPGAYWGSCGYCEATWPPMKTEAAALRAVEQTAFYGSWDDLTHPLTDVPRRHEGPPTQALLETSVRDAFAALHAAGEHGGGTLADGIRRLAGRHQTKETHHVPR